MPQIKGKVMYNNEELNFETDNVIHTPVYDTHSFIQKILNRTSFLFRRSDRRTTLSRLLLAVGQRAFPLTPL